MLEVLLPNATEVASVMICEQNLVLKTWFVTIPDPCLPGVPSSIEIQ